MQDQIIFANSKCPTGFDKVVSLVNIYNPGTSITLLHSSLCVNIKTECMQV